MSTCVVAVVATFRRPRELARLLDSLHGVEAVVVCNNGADPEVRDACEKAPVPAVCLDSEANLGCGAGLRLAEEEAWKRFGERLTHLLVVDDDAVLEADTVSKLLEVLDREGATVVYPLATGSDGRTGWTPGLINRAERRLGNEPLSVEEYRARLRSEVADFDWAQGICLLIRRDAVEKAGFHRADFWVRGEDLDFSLRLTACGRGVFAPDVVVRHLPPENAVASSGPAEYLRHAAMIQNIAYLGLRQAHGRRIAFSLVGAARRFLSTWGTRSIGDVFRAVWRGAVFGEPAGAGAGNTFRRRFDDLVAR